MFTYRRPHAHAPSMCSPLIKPRLFRDLIAPVKRLPCVSALAVQLSDPMVGRRHTGAGCDGSRKWASMNLTREQVGFVSGMFCFVGNFSVSNLLGSFNHERILFRLVHSLTHSSTTHSLTQSLKHNSLTHLLKHNDETVVNTVGGVRMCPPRGSQQYGLSGTEGWVERGGVKCGETKSENEFYTLMALRRGRCCRGID